MKSALFLLLAGCLPLVGCYSGHYSGGASYYYGTDWHRYPYWYDDDDRPHYVAPSKPAEPGDRIPSRPGRPGNPMHPGTPGSPGIPTRPSRPPGNIGRPISRPMPRPRPRPAPRPMPRRAR